jgi:hypothetical protein
MTKQMVRKELLEQGVKIKKLEPRGLGAEPGLLSELILVDIV